MTLPCASTCSREQSSLSEYARILSAASFRSSAATPKSDDGTAVATNDPSYLCCVAGLTCCRLSSRGLSADTAARCGAKESSSGPVQNSRLLQAEFEPMLSICCD